ncbi:MAG TPA: ComF family protein, partial [Candidatus Limnocylindria bacterium]|nr:ComF family protein [Candidatus Limnocylindria bacterium]
RPGGGGEDVGDRRRERLASPPRVRAAGPAPDLAVLVDDVVTTGATLTACAAALRGAGGRGVGAVAFARSSDPRSRGFGP